MLVIQCNDALKDYFVYGNFYWTVLCILLYLLMFSIISIWVKPLRKLVYLLWFLVFCLIFPMFINFLMQTNPLLDTSWIRIEYRLSRDIKLQILKDHMILFKEVYPYFNTEMDAFLYDSFLNQTESLNDRKPVAEFAVLFLKGVYDVQADNWNQHFSRLYLYRNLPHFFIPALYLPVLLKYSIVNINYLTFISIVWFGLPYTVYMRGWGFDPIKIEFPLDKIMFDMHKIILEAKFYANAPINIEFYVTIFIVLNILLLLYLLYYWYRAVVSKKK